MKDNSWLKLHRRILSWEWFSDSKTFHVFLYLLIRANIRTSRWNGRVIKRGQLVTSYQKIAAATGMSVSSARRAIDNLVSTGEIITEPTNKYNLITIVKYETYQTKYEDSEQADEQSDEQTEEQTTEQHNKNNRRRKEERKNAGSSAAKQKNHSLKQKCAKYIPQYWESGIPEHYWGRFHTEDEYYDYAGKNAEEVEQWLTN